MAIVNKRIKLETKGDTDIIDITERVAAHLKGSALTNGTVTVFVPGSTAGITTVEYEPGVIKDLQRAFEEIASKDREYAHNKKWGDMNGYSHVRASLLGPSISVPFINGELQLGRWQQIILIDFDNRSRSREIILQIMGE
ncbi:secondary thiamine-phosphate synthase enzyme YjbQ [bacterium]|nr:secondary thiamine-phosphate synthase enzyme YjbQ [bacterium]MCK4436535.1 secondary thiamine-phosphate synthase enzyme YjbQ [bacterium]